MITPSIVCAAIALFAVTSAAARPAASQVKTAWSVTAPDGASVSGDLLGAADQWLLVYLTPGSVASDRLVRWLAETRTPDRAARVVLIISSSASEARAYIAGTGGEDFATTAAWYVDPRREAWKALGFQGNLAVAGMVGQKTEWKIDGVIADPSVLAPAMSKWLEER